MPDPALILAIGAAVLLGLAVAWYGVGMFVRACSDAGARRQTIGRGRLMLTYDDGPGRTVTPDLLDLLKQRDVRATFFLIGRAAESSPDVVERLATEGHVIGWHSQTHRNQWKCDPLRAVLDVWRPPAILSAGPTAATVFRPPYGKMTLGTVLAAAVRRLPIVTWTHVSGDTHDTLPDPASIVAMVEQDGGGVVLMHDMDRPDRTRPDYVLDLTRRLIDLAARRHWAITTPIEIGGRP